MRRIVFCVLFLPLWVSAGEVLDSQVELTDDHYRVAITARIAAPRPHVYQAITDYTNLASINPSIVESNILLAISPRKHRIETVFRLCILIFCKRIRQVQDVEQVDESLITAVTLPDVSDFKYGLAQWQLTGQGDETELYFTQAFEPDFWVPAVIGPWLIERTLIREMVETSMYIELLSDEHDRQD